MSTDRSQLRASTTPEAAIEVEPVQRLDFEVLQSGWIVYEEWQYGVPVDLPTELATRELLQQDLHDPTVAMQFVSQFGCILDSFDNRLRFRGAAPPTTRPRRSTVHVGDVVLHLAACRAAARHWLARTRYDDECDELADAWTCEGFGRVESAEDAWRNLITYFRYGLASAVPRVQLEVRTKAQARNKAHGEIVYGEPRHSLANGLCIQLFNLLAERLPGQQCTNDLCRTWFVRQRGRAKHDQHRLTGVSYCSDACAKAHTQRLRRQRARTNLEER